MIINVFVHEADGVPRKDYTTTFFDSIASRASRCDPYYCSPNLIMLLLIYVAISCFNLIYFNFPGILVWTIERFDSADHPPHSGYSIIYHFRDYVVDLCADAFFTFFFSFSWVFWVAMVTNDIPI